MMRLVKFPDETINDIPEADIVPNAALTYLQQYPTAYRRLCTNHSAGHAIDACNFVHFRNAVRQPAPPQAPPGPASLCIGVVVDGFCFTKRFGWDTEAFTQLINDITRWISQAANAAALVHKDAKVFLYPNSTDARRKQLISDAQLSSTMSALDRLRDAGWRVIPTNFKLVGELWKATAEDVAFSNECASLCRTGALAPLGANPARITLHHVVIVTGDNDHVSTFGTQSNNELRWLVDMNPSPAPNQPLRRAAREAQRLIPFTAVPVRDVDPPHVAVPTPAPNDDKLKQQEGIVRKNPWAVVSAAVHNPFPPTEKLLIRHEPSLLRAKAFRTKEDRDAWVASHQACNNNGMRAAQLVWDGSSFRTTDEGPLNTTERCDQAASCDAYDCVLLHPEGRRARCDNAECESLQCDKLHRVLEVRTLDGTRTKFPTNHLLSTAGKKNAAEILKTTGKPPQLCKLGAAVCKRKTACNFIHVNASLPSAVQAEEKEVPEGFILCNGELVAEDDIEDNAGKTQAIQVRKRRGVWCKNKPCTFAANCTYLHRRFTPSVTAEIAALREQLVQEVVAPPPPSVAAAAAVKLCLICDDELAPTSTFECSAGHALCHGCFSSYITQTWAARGVQPGEIPALRCAIPDCAAQPMTDTQVAKNANEEALGAYLEVRQRARDAKTFADAQRLVEEARKKTSKPGEMTDAERKLLQEQLRREMPQARMCPRCSTGPIDVRGCSDLRAHHGQQVAGGARISNSCPTCQFFTPNLADWPMWDGVLRAPTEASAAADRKALDMVQFVVEAMLCSEEEARAAIEAVQQRHRGGSMNDRETVSAAIDHLDVCKRLGASVTQSSRRNVAVASTTVSCWTFRIADNTLQCFAGSLRVDFPGQSNGWARMYRNSANEVTVWSGDNVVERLSPTPASPPGTSPNPPTVLGAWTIQRRGTSYEVTNRECSGRYELGNAVFSHTAR